MTNTNELRRIFNGRFQVKQNRLSTTPGTLGNGLGVVKVAGRPNYVYVRIADAVEEVFCNRVPPENDLLVLVGYDAIQPDIYQVLSTRSYSPMGITGGGVTGYAPAKRYQWMAKDGGEDPLWVEMRQFLPLRIGPYNGMMLQVYRGFIYTGSAFQLVDSQLFDMTSYIPATTGMTALVLITINDVGAVVGTKGTETTASYPGLSLIPAIPSNTIEVLGAVRVYYGQTLIQETRTDTDIIDLRNTVGGSTSSSGTPGGGGGATAFTTRYYFRNEASDLTGYSTMGTGYTSTSHYVYGSQSTAVELSLATFVTASRTDTWIIPAGDWTMSLKSNMTYLGSLVYGTTVNAHVKKINGSSVVTELFVIRDFYVVPTTLPKYTLVLNSSQPEIVLAADERLIVDFTTVNKIGNPVFMVNLYTDPTGTDSLPYTYLDIPDANGVGTLSALSDVAISAVANGDVLTYDSGLSRWVNGVPGGSALSWFNVRSYGAIGDGTTDDTAAITAAITALNTAGGGVLYFPPGTYKTSGGFTISHPSTVLGMGSGDHGSPIHAVSKVLCTSSTAILFTVDTAAQPVNFRDLAMVNTSGTTPTAGAAISVNSGDLAHYENLSIYGFWIGLDIVKGGLWKMNGCTIGGPVKYALKILYVGAPDSGDQFISDCVFWAAGQNSDAAIRYESGGGLKIVNCKINMLSGVTRFTHGIDLAMIGSATTVIMLVSNCSIENVSGNGINITTNASKPSSFSEIIISGNEFGLWSNSTGYPININPDAAGDVFDVIITGNAFRSDTGSPSITAINIAKLDNVFIGSNTYRGYTGILTQTSCTNVLQVGTGTVTNVNTGTGLTGGAITTSGTISLANTTVTPGGYTNANITIDAQGRITAASNGSSTSIGNEIVMQSGTSSPPVPIWTSDGADYVYSS